MKRLIIILLIICMTLLTACNDEASSNATGKELTLDENAFGVHVTVKNMTNEKVKFIVSPHADEFGYGGQGEIGPQGIYGTDGLVPGKKKGEKVDLEGSFTLYAHDTNGPSVTINVKGTYAIDALNNDFKTMHFFYYQDGKFTKTDEPIGYK